MLASISLSQGQKSTHPSNALVDVGGSVRETLGLTGLSANETVEVRANLVRFTSTKGVTLGASGLWYMKKKGRVCQWSSDWMAKNQIQTYLEDTSTLRSVTYCTITSTAIPFYRLRHLCLLNGHLPNPNEPSSSRGSAGTDRKTTYQECKCHRPF